MLQSQAERQVIVTHVNSLVRVAGYESWAGFKTVRRAKTPQAIVLSST
jgi:hypothetical protein